MATYNGAQTLEQQLRSLKNQDVRHWNLTVSDDGSTDGTIALIKHFAQVVSPEAHQVTLKHGPGHGFSANFLSMFADLPDDAGAVALSDQDDVWFPDKLTRALIQLEKIAPSQPAMYCSRRYIWWPERNDRRIVSQNYTRPTGFANALVENIAPGNTIVLNAAAARIARAAAQRCTQGIFAHDWWLYLIISGVGGVILFDQTPTLLYRQHGTNTIGAGEAFGTMLANKRRVLKGIFTQRVSSNIAALVEVEDMLAPENRNCLALFRQAREARFPHRLSLMARAGVYRQKTASNIGFWGAVTLGLT